MRANSEPDPVDPAARTLEWGQSRTDLRIVVLDFAMRRSQSSGVSQVMNEMFLSRSAWLIELHWSSCRLPGRRRVRLRDRPATAPVLVARLDQLQTSPRRPPSGSPCPLPPLQRRSPRPALSALERGRPRRRHFKTKVAALMLAAA